jgi:hypothetical protein
MVSSPMGFYVASSAFECHRQVLINGRGPFLDRSTRLTVLRFLLGGGLTSF